MQAKHTDPLDCARNQRVDALNMQEHLWAATHDARCSIFLDLLALPLVILARIPVAAPSWRA